MQKNIFLILGISFVVAIFVLGGQVASRRSLTPFEFYLLSGFAILVSGLISFFGGQKVIRDEVKNSLKGEAQKALRRIIVISESTRRISENVQQKLNRLRVSSEVKTEKSNELILEYFDGIGNQIKDLMTNIKASVEDWRDILPEEFKKKDEQNKKLVEASEKAIQEKDAIERKYKTELKKYKEDETKREALIKALRGELDSTVEKYQVEIAKIKSEYGPRLSELLTLDEILGVKKPSRKFSQDFSQAFFKDLDNDTTNISEEVRKKSEEKPEDNSTVAEIKDNNEEKEQVSKKDDAPMRVSVPEEDSEREESKEKK